jgi:hypothetical protein
MDYEHTPANHLSFRLAHLIIVPAVISPAMVRRFGASPSKVVHYDGFKEQVYLDAFVPDRSRLDPHLLPSIWRSYVVAVARPPADFAVYHRFQNPLFETWLRQAGTDPSVRIVTIPRTAEQRKQLESLCLPSVIVPTAALDGANLIYHADLVVSAGGTMNREAAVLGVPVYSIFTGRPSAVDRALENLGRLQCIRSLSGLNNIRFTKHSSRDPLRSPGLCSAIVDAILQKKPLAEISPPLAPDSGGS